MDREEFWRRVGVAGMTLMAIEGVAFLPWVVAGVWDNETGVRFLAWLAVVIMLSTSTARMYYDILWK